MNNPIPKPLSCKLPQREKAIEAIYSLIWRKVKKDREIMFTERFKKNSPIKLS